jgi:hypothetical protein
MIGWLTVLDAQKNIWIFENMKMWTSEYILPEHAINVLCDDKFNLFRLVEESNDGMHVNRLSLISGFSHLFIRSRIEHVSFAIEMFQLSIFNVRISNFRFSIFECRFMNCHIRSMQCNAIQYNAIQCKILNRLRAVLSEIQILQSKPYILYHHQLFPIRSKKWIFFDISNVIRYLGWNWSENWTWTWTWTWTRNWNWNWNWNHDWLNEWNWKEKKWKSNQIQLSEEKWNEM